MSVAEAEYNSDAPEEFTSYQGMQQDEEIRKVQSENKARVVRERKLRRKQWAQRMTLKMLPRENNSRYKTLSQTHEESHDDSVDNTNRGMLPDEIVKFLAAREKKVFTSDSEDEKPEKKPAKRKRRLNKSGLDLVVLNELPPALCVQNSLDFLKMRKMQVSRSPSVLNNSDKALRLLSKLVLPLAKVGSGENDI